MAKKKSVQTPRQFSPIEYIKTKARLLPIYKCYINSYWLECGLTNIVIARQHKTGNFTIGCYYIDTYHKGLFKSGAYFNFTKAELDKMVSRIVPKSDEEYMVIEIDYSLAHNIIYGGLEFAEKKGYSPGKDFEISKYILEENDGKIEYIEIGFGKSQLRKEGEDELYIDCIEKILKK